MASRAKIKLYGTATSLALGIGKALVIGGVPGAFAYFLLTRTPLPYNVIDAGAMTAWALGTVSTIKAMDTSEGDVAIGFYGLHKVRGDFTGMTFGYGRHPLLPGGLEELELVDGRDTPFDSPAFEELAKDKVPVFVDAYFVAYIADPYRYKERVESGSATTTLMDTFDAEIRLFVAQWLHAADLVASKELLAQFLMLTGRNTPEALELKNELMKLTVPDEPGEKPMLTQKGVENIMLDAGKFCQDAEEWGYVVTKVHAEKVDLPKYIKDAAAKAVAARYEMDEAQVRQARRLEMIKEFKRELPGLTDNEARLGIDLLLKLSTETVTEFKFRDLEQVSANLGAGGAMATRALERLARRFGLNQRKGA